MGDLKKRGRAYFDMQIRALVATLLLLGFAAALVEELEEQEIFMPNNAEDNLTGEEKALVAAAGDKDEDGLNLHWSQVEGGEDNFKEGSSKPAGDEEGEKEDPSDELSNADKALIAAADGGKKTSAVKRHAIITKHTKKAVMTSFGPTDSLGHKYHIWQKAKKAFFKARGPSWPPSRNELKQDKRDFQYGSKAYRMANLVLRKRLKFAKQYHNYKQATKRKAGVRKAKLAFLKALQELKHATVIYRSRKRKLLYAPLHVPPPYPGSSAHP